LIERENQKERLKERSVARDGTLEGPAAQGTEKEKGKGLSKDLRMRPENLHGEMERILTQLKGNAHPEQNGIKNHNFTRDGCQTSRERKF